MNRFILRPPVAVPVLAGLLVVLALQWPAGRGFEDRIHDLIDQARYEIHGARIHEDLFLVAIDDQSVDPRVSPFSDLWGRGGWITREHWNFQLAFYRDFFRPRVLVYDILFLPSEKVHQSAPMEALARRLSHGGAIKRQQLNALVEAGNNELENLLWDISLGLDAGEDHPVPVFAFIFPADTRRAHLLERGDESRQMALKRQALPADAIEEGPGDAPEAVQLPLMNIAGVERVRLGAINVNPDRGGVVRRVPLLYEYRPPDGGRHYLPGLALAAVLSHWGIRPEDLHPPGAGFPSLRARAGEAIVISRSAVESVHIPVDDQFRITLNNRFRYADISKAPYFQVTASGFALLGGQGDALSSQLQRELRDRMIFIAQAYTGAGDVGNFPLEEQIPNVTAHMMAADNILSGDFRTAPAPWQPWLLGAAIALFGWLVWRSGGAPAPWILGVASLLYPLVVLLLSILEYGGGHSVYVLFPTLGMAGIYTAHMVGAYREASAQRQWIRDRFAAAVSPKVLALLEEEPDQAFRPQRVCATIFFSDVAGFTTISEKLSPVQLSDLLNAYLSPMSEIIMRSEGYVDKYEGDAIMAVWGVPQPLADHAAVACQAALRQQELLAGMQDRLDRDFGFRLQVRMGINSGEVSAGFMGSEGKQQYTVMGDAVNLAARLEPANKDYGTPILVGEETFKLARADRSLLFRQVDRLLVKGKSRPVGVYECLRPEGNEAWVGEFEQGLKCYWVRRWDEAEAIFRRVERMRGGDGPSTTFLERIAVLRASPPGEDWDGAYVRSAKD